MPDRHQVTVTIVWDGPKLKSNELDALTTRMEKAAGEKFELYCDEKQEEVIPS